MTALSKESAAAQLQVMFDYYEIDLADLPEEQQPAVRNAEMKLVKAIRNGRLEIKPGDDGVVSIVQTVKNGETLDYGEVNGEAKVAMGLKKDGDSYGKAYALMGSLCGGGEAVIMKLKGKDLSTAEALGILFMQA